MRYKETDCPELKVFDLRIFANNPGLYRATIQGE
jgi:hypothetical protein